MTSGNLCNKGNMPWKWDEEEWKNDKTWWTPYNAIGRLKGKGTTSWSRQERRANETPEEREERKKKREEKKLLEKEQQEAKGKESLQERQEDKAISSKEPLEKREETATSSKDPLEKREEAATSSKDPLEKREEAANTKEPLEKRQEAANTQEPLEKRQEAANTKESLEKKEEAANTKESLEKKEEAASTQEPLEKRQEPVYATVERQDENSWVLVEKRKKRSKQWIKKGEQLWESEPLQAAQTEHQPLKEVARRKVDGGYVAKAHTSSSSSSISLSCQEMAKKVPRHKDGTKVAIDWHGTFETKVNGRDDVPSSHVRGLWDLQEAGYHAVLLSYCGPRREKEVKEKLSYLPCRFQETMFTRNRTGWGGKVELCKAQGINIIVDDNAEIIYEAWQHGMEVMPIKTPWCYWSSKWYSEQGIHAYESFEEVAEHLAKFSFP